MVERRIEGAHVVSASDEKDVARTARSVRFDDALLVVIVVSLSIQGPDLFVFGGMNFTLGHVIVGLSGLAALIRCATSGRRPIAPPWGLNVLYLVFAVVTVVDAPAFGFGAMILKYLFQYLVLVVALNFMRLMEPERAERCIMVGAWVVLVAVLLNAIAHAGAFVEYYRRPWDGHPNYATLISGGVNLEATWPAMLGVFCKNNRSGKIYLTTSFAFALVLQSRAGILLSAAAVAYVLLVRAPRSAVRRVIAVLVVAALGVAAIVVGPRAWAESATDPIEVVANDGAGEEVITVTPGRIGIWSTALEAFADSPVTGYGAGQAMDAVRELSRYSYREDNVHNYPLQVLLDFGVIGFTAFALVVACFLVSNVRARFRSPFAAFILLYLCGGLIQFRGGELLVGFAIAGLLAFGPNMAMTGKR